MTMILTITDNADRTGAVATIAGSLGAVNTVWTQQDPLGGQVWPGFVSTGSRTGDGTVALSIPPGYYWAYVQNAAGISNLVRFAATDSTQSVATRLRAALVARLQGLIMAGTPNANIFPALVENMKTIVFPCITVASAGEAERDASQLTGQDDIIYPFRCKINDRRSPDDDSQKAVYELWKQQAMRSMRKQRFTTVPESLTCEVQPRKNSFLVGPGWQLWSMEFAVMCRARENRGS